jgi:hypothetical protein
MQKKGTSLSQKKMVAVTTTGFRRPFKTCCAPCEKYELIVTWQVLLALGVCLN